MEESEDNKSDPGQVVGELEVDEEMVEQEDIDDQPQPDIPEDNESLEDNQIDNEVDPEQLAAF